MLRIFRVTGSSMEPTLSDGDYVVAATRLWRPRSGTLVVATHREYGVLIKRLSQWTKTGYMVTSDNPQGSDSRTLGKIPEDQVIGRVVFRVRRPTGMKRSPAHRSRAASP